jgi:hypothetical protein
MFQRDGEGLRRQKRTQTTLRRVVWVLLGMFFFYSCSSYTNYGFYFYVGSIYVLKARGGPGWMAMTKTGPNDVDASFGLVGVFFLFFFCFFLCFLIHQLPFPSSQPRPNGRGSHTHTGSSGNANGGGRRSGGGSISSRGLETRDVRHLNLFFFLFFHYFHLLLGYR